MEGGLVEHRRYNNLGHVSSSKIIKKKRVKRKSFEKDVNIQVCFGLQRLYSYCKNVFKGVGFVPPPQDVVNLCTILDSMKPEDLGLSKELEFFKSGRRVNEIPRVTCTTVYECPQNRFSLVLFFLPPAAVIPLHNHPEMTVFSKLLLGTMHVKAYDWDDSDVKVENHEQLSSLSLARLKANRVFTAPCNTSVLYPTSGGNIHAFTAITPCAVLDVIGPPYSKKDGRDCTYYKDFKCRFSDGNNEQSYAWLKETEVPEKAKMDCITYLGPRVVETTS